MSIIITMFIGFICSVVAAGTGWGSEAGFLMFIVACTIYSKLCPNTVMARLNAWCWLIFCLLIGYEIFKQHTSEE